MPFKLPLPLIQIALGAMLAWPGFGLHVTFDPEIFLMLFIPPLLFADGWRIPKRELYMQRRAILMLALGLVFITVGALGFDLMHRYGDQAAFVATGGYHHHVGLNTWMSSGAALAPASAAGLDRVVFSSDGEARESEDPDGIRVALAP